MTSAGRIALLGTIAVTCPIDGQAVPNRTPIPWVDDFVHDGNVGEWRARPIDRILPADTIRPQALLWLGTVDEGLVVAAEIRTGATIRADAVLEIGLTGPDSLVLPPFGWGHQFGFEVVTDSAGCAALAPGVDAASCNAWLARQRIYRRALPRLFQRDWRVPVMRPDEVVEVRARPAFDRFSPGVRSRIAALEPRGRLRVLGRPIAGTEGGLGLEVLIPWTSFPPVRAPDLVAVRLRVEWAAGESVAPGDADWGRATTRRALARPLAHRITPCDYGLAGVLIPGGMGRSSRAASPDAVPYMIPEGSGDLRSLIVLDNEAAGYQYDPDSASVSPAAFATTYEVQDLGRDERLCTPHLALVRGGERLTAPDWTTTGERNPFAALVDPRELQVRRLDNGDLIAMNGPLVEWSYYGSGQCGGCPRVGMDVFHLSATTGEVTPSFQLLEIAEPDASDVEIEVSDDWRTVTVFRSRVDFDRDPSVATWSSRTYCAEDDPAAEDEPWHYRECGREGAVPEPPNRLRRRYSEVP
jgi:hypothetical protein